MNRPNFHNPTRRALLASICLPLLALPISHPLAADRGSANVSAASALLTMVSSNPYVMGAKLAFDIFGAISSADFQRSTKRSLKQIRRQLAELQVTVNLVLQEVQRLPQVIRRELSEQRKNEILSEIAAHHKLVDGVLAKYEAPYRAIAIKGDDARTLTDATAKVIQLSFQLDQWGDEAFLALAEAYGIFLITRRVTGLSVVDKKYLVHSYGERISDASSRFRHAKLDEISAAENLERQLPTTGVEYYLGNWSRVLFDNQGTYGSLVRDKVSGFKVERSRYGQKDNLERRPTVQDLGAQFRTYSVDPRHTPSDRVAHFLAIANGIASQAREHRTKQTELYELEIASAAILEAMRKEIPGVGAKVRNGSIRQNR